MTPTHIFQAALLTCALAPLAQAGTITTVAGTGTAGSAASPDGVATESDLANPHGLALDAQGGIYVADRTRVRRFEVGGLITTVPNTTGQAQPLVDVAVGSGGTLYMSTETHVLRAAPTAATLATATVGSFFAGLALSTDGAGLYATAPIGEIVHIATASGTVTRSSGLPVSGWGVGLALAGGSLYFTGEANVWRIDNPGASLTLPASPIAGGFLPGFSGDGGPADEAQLHIPYHAVPDGAGNLYIADTGNHRIRRVDGLGLISTVAGTGAESSTGDGGSPALATLSYPRRLALDASGRLYVVEGYRVRMITFDTPPAVPTGVTATLLGNRAIVRWEHGGAGTTGFTAAVDGDPRLRCTAAPGERSCAIDGLSDGWDYRFKAVAHNGDGVSAASAPSPEYVVPYEIYGGDLDLDDTGARQAGVSIGSPVGMHCVLVRNAEFTSEPPSGVPAPPASAPLGVLHFQAEECAAGDRITVRIDYPPGSLAGLSPWKYGPPAAGAAPTWFRHGQVVGDSVYYEVENDGTGDNAPDDIGLILDPHAMLGALPAAAPQAIPTLSAWGVALLSALAALLGLRRRI